MVGLSEEDIKNLSPTMTVKDIKKYVKSLNGKALPELSEGNADAEDEAIEETVESDNIVDVEAVELEHNTLIKCDGKEDYEKKIDTIDEYIMRVFKNNPDAVIEISYTLPSKQ